jgi:hypothetical protein
VRPAIEVLDAMYAGVGGSSMCACIKRLVWKSCVDKNGSHRCLLSLFPNISSFPFHFKHVNLHLQPLLDTQGELVVKEHASKFGRTASSWPKAALASLRRRHDHLVFLVHQV